MYANSLKYIFMKFINWEQKGNFNEGAYLPIYRVHFLF